MAHSILLKAAGLYTDPNDLGSVPEGAMSNAENINIDRQDLITPRRGLTEYGTVMGISSNRAKQFLVYKDRLLRHYASTLQYDNLRLQITSLTSSGTVATATTSAPHGLSNTQIVSIAGSEFPEYNGSFPISSVTSTTFQYTISNSTVSPSQGTVYLDSGTFTSYSGSIDEAEIGLRIKGIEQNGNFYFTSSSGIRKLEQITGPIKDSGMYKALDVEASLVNQPGFFVQNSQVAYRVLWGIKDLNNNLILGAPSGRVVLSNPITNLVVMDFNRLLNKLDLAAAADAGDGLSDTDYSSSLTIPASSSALTLHTSLVSLCSKLDADMAVATYSTIAASHPAPGTPPTEAELLDIQDFYDEIIDALLAEPLVNISAAGQTAGDFQNSTQSQSVRLKFTIPSGVTTSHFYQVYRTALSLNADTDPGDNMGLVFEGNPTAGEITAGTVSLTDITPDDFIGADLYTNPNQETISQANDIPPFAKDITVYKGSVFYANTKTRQRQTLDLLGVSNLISGVSTITIGGIIYTFYTSVSEITQVDTVVSSGFPSSGASAYFTLAAGENVELYYVWYQRGTSVDPAISGRTGIQIPVTGTETADEVANLTAQALNTYADFSAEINTNPNRVLITNVLPGPATDAVANTSGFTVSVITQGDGNDPVTGRVGISSSSTPAQKVADTAKNLIKVINRRAASVVYAYYLSGEFDVPGKILLEAKSLSQVSFTITVDSVGTGSSFSPDPFLTAVASTNEVRGNRLYYSKANQPEAVPLLNYIDVGALDSEIKRVLALRDSLFIFKRDAIYRITGESTDSLQLSVFDSSTKIVCPDSAAIGENQIFVMTDQGIVKVSDTGVETISKRIEDQLIKLFNPEYKDVFVSQSWGTFYETERKYLFATIENSTDTYPTRIFVFNTFTKTWTKYSVGSTCGVVNADGDNKLYIGDNVSNLMLQERKAYSFTDQADKSILKNVTFVDRLYDVTLLTSNGTTATVTTSVQHKMQSGAIVNIYGASPFAYNGSYEVTVTGDFTFTYQIVNALSSPATGTIKVRVKDQTLTLVNASGIEIGDAVVQPLYLTVNRLNALLAKLDTDSGLYDSNYFSTLRVVDYNEITAKVVALAAKLNADPGTTLVYSAFLTSDAKVLQSYFNGIITNLNIDPGVTQDDYDYSTSGLTKIARVNSVDTITDIVTLDKQLSYVPGDILVYKAIKVKIEWVPQHAGDPALLKQFNEAQLMFNTFSVRSAIIGFKSDVQDNVEEITLEGPGLGGWGLFQWGEALWGGGDLKRGYRTYVPVGKQRSRLLFCRYRHINAYEQFQLAGLSVNYRPISVRVNR